MSYASGKTPPRPRDTDDKQLTNVVTLVIVGAVVLASITPAIERMAHAVTPLVVAQIVWSDSENHTFAQIAADLGRAGQAHRAAAAPEQTLSEILGLHWSKRPLAEYRRRLIGRVVKTQVALAVRCLSRPRQCLKHVISHTTRFRSPTRTGTETASARSTG